MKHEQSTFKAFRAFTELMRHRFYRAKYIPRPFHHSNALLLLADNDAQQAPGMDGVLQAVQQYANQLQHQQEERIRQQEQRIQELQRQQQQHHQGPPTWEQCMAGLLNATAEQRQQLVAALSQQEQRQLQLLNEAPRVDVQRNNLAAFVEFAQGPRTPAELLQMHNAMPAFSMRRVFDFIDGSNREIRHAIALHVMRYGAELDVVELAAEAPVNLRVAHVVHFIQNMNVLPQAEADIYVAAIRAVLPAVSIRTLCFSALNGYINEPAEHQFSALHFPIRQFTFMHNFAIFVFSGSAHVASCIRLY